MMPDENETNATPSGSRPSFDPLVSALGYLIQCKRSGYPGNEGRPEFSASFASLLEWAENAGLIRDETEFPFFRGKPDGFGQEHEAWYDERSGLWLKATYHNQFGLSWARSASANAQDYLQRLVLQNDFFGDEIHLEAVVKCGTRIRVLTSQPHISGEPATYNEIQKWFFDLGFTRLELGGGVAWYHHLENLLVADAHEGNVIMTPRGQLIPIDLNICKPDEEMLKGIRTLPQPETGDD